MTEHHDVAVIKAGFFEVAHQECDRRPYVIAAAGCGVDRDQFGQDIACQGVVLRAGAARGLAEQQNSEAGDHWQGFLHGVLPLCWTMRRSVSLPAVMRIPTNMVLLLLLLGAAPVAAELDLQNASLTRLDNGLTVILLEDRNFPVVSVQTLYRVGARNEVSGKTGLAHFLEHMAFRSSENFPDTGLVSSIYARGGEWHGYTWIDQTTYFATAPKEQLDLLLRIEADRMARLDIAIDDMDAERGAVLAEMHMYENDPGSMLIDAVNYLTFLGHPYRNNTIGWQSDIEHLRHEDVVAFYRRHYHPSNAVLVVVGDFDPARVRARIAKLFAAFAKQAPTPLPHTIEPPQNGARRVLLHGAAGQRQFRIAWRAPAAGSPDFAAFLVLQSLLGASSGVNFNQNDWGSEVAAGAILDGAADSLTTWYPPSAQDYVFVVGGSAPAGKTESRDRTGGHDAHRCVASQRAGQRAAGGRH